MAVGIEGWAPGRVTEMAATAEAKTAQRSTSTPRIKATAKPALKASPAAVVSMAATENAGTRSSGKSRWAIKHPREPSFKITFSMLSGPEFLIHSEG